MNNQQTNRSKPACPPSGRGLAAAGGIGRRYTVTEKKRLLDAFQNSQLGVVEFCSRNHISQPSLYHWRKLLWQKGSAGLENRPNIAKTIPGKTPPAVRAAILDVKELKPSFGIRKIRDFLARLRLIKVSHETVRRTLHQEGVAIGRKRSRINKPRRVKSFERPTPNALWQMDIMTFTLKRLYQRVYLIGIIDDHSRYIVGCGLYGSQTQSNVLEVLKRTIVEHGLPQELMTDNGRQFVAWQGKSKFQREVIQKGINHIRSSPRHPQTLGKIERFWRNIWQEFLAEAVFESFEDARQRIDAWIQYYNHQRPHQGIEGLMPADRYYRVAAEVKQTIASGCAANALAIARTGKPKKPFYLVGRLGDKELTIKAEGDKVEINLDGESIEQINLKEEKKDDRPEESKRTAETGNSAQGAQREPERPADLPGAPDNAAPVLPAAPTGAAGDAGVPEAQEAGAQEPPAGPAEEGANQGEPEAAPGEDAGGTSPEHSPENTGLAKGTEPVKGI